jgi:hypothetical protein
MVLHKHLRLYPYKTQMVQLINWTSQNLQMWLVTQRYIDDGSDFLQQILFPFTFVGQTAP